jgi:hypothetical protein
MQSKFSLFSVLHRNAVIKNKKTKNVLEINYLGKVLRHVFLLSFCLPGVEIVYVED